ncbi:hypothetical protein HYV84_01220 [Candidatus Woesearchaeota archaeon]|nr:hypothetical protein [Candidatus Woesearchaeota archaeon]
MAQETQAAEITITYGSLLELLLREKERGELQKLDADFFSNVVRYLKDKQAILQAKSDLFSFEEKEKTIKQLSNIRKMLKELYERREKKVVVQAIEKSRDKQSIMDASVFLPHEKDLFDSTISLLDRYRQGILDPLLGIQEQSPTSPARAAIPAFQQFSKEQQHPQKETKLVRFLHAVPKFVGKELEEYGPFEEEDIAALPVVISEILIKKGRVEEIQEN